MNGIYRTNTRREGGEKEALKACDQTILATFSVGLGVNIPAEELEANLDPIH